MMRSLLKLAVRGYIRGPAKSWLFTSGAMLLWRAVTRSSAKTELVDLSGTKPGDRLIIEHLDISHGEQMKQLKKDRKAERRALKSAKRADRRARKSSG